MSAELQAADEPAAPFVDGRSTPSSDPARVEVVDPSTGQVRLRIPAGSDADADGAVASARRSFEDGRWSDAPPSFKKKTLQRLADLIALHADALDILDAGEMGKPVAERFCNAAAAASYLRFYAEALDKISGDVFTSDKHCLVAQRRVPIGVVAAIVPWNFPTFNAVLKLAPALAAGNCVVLKPSEMATRSALYLARLALEAGLPPGVLNVVPGLGETVGRALGLHPDVDMVTFTGSTAVGKLMLQYAGQSNMKKVLAECGGKSPQIVFDDGVDLDAASAAIAASLLLNQGQVCSVGSRLLVQQSIEAALLEKIVARLGSLVIGNALDPKTTFGPLVSAQQCRRVMELVSGAGREGAEVVVGGRRLLERAGGCFFEPTVLRGVSRRARVAREEIFGPVLSVIAFGDEAEAVSIANDTNYGLAAYVWTAGLTTGMRMARAIRSSIVINSAAPNGEGAGHAFSSEPAKQSGLGTEGGLAGMESYLRRQLVWFSHG